MGGRKKRRQREHSAEAVTKRQRQQDENQSFTTPEGQVLPAELKKYWRSRHRFFWRFDEGIQIDEEGWYSVTPEVIADDTALRVAQLHNDRHSEPDYGRICIIDAFCGVGGNTIKFAEWCEHVIAIDIDPQRLEMARNNAVIYGVADRIEFILGDFYQLAPTLKADVVFMSPPWGGPEYTDASVFALDSMPFHSAQEWVDRARLVSANIAFFMPRNCDPLQLADLVPDVPCDIELNYTSGFFKAITAYYGDLALFGSSDPQQLL
ncbi:Trimethylguanosine synthase [Coemansia sp. RSA 1813]|nr:Trimethylguanosine synthase [Coemansia sp. RSA 1646]KAJ1769938.1 Trimethylguanosine synthase [Coemansia sp. RSA 1843]KAJ2087849.1 Trimethylguanosine synthase [Coemansia sp. RSA 986]KAJ2212741.1 Trimethylguanosine synthase [Coemansia sp. RSA 487]KAJ2567480.1 Trimethylguanosine synthase [Coemansia sp. RSA 1813]